MKRRLLIFLFCLLPVLLFAKERPYYYNTSSWLEMVGTLKNLFSQTSIGQKEFINQNIDKVLKWAGFVIDANVSDGGQYYLVLIVIKPEDRGWNYTNAQTVEELKVAKIIFETRYILLCSKEYLLKYKKGDYVEFTGNILNYKEGILLIQLNENIE